jgi:hypothetical protein
MASGEKTKSGGERERSAGPFEAQGKLKPGLFLCSGGSLDPCFSLLAFLLGVFALLVTGLKTGHYKEGRLSATRLGADL